jgi:hypothetical protein
MMTSSPARILVVILFLLILLYDFFCILSSLGAQTFRVCLVGTSNLTHYNCKTSQPAGHYWGPGIFQSPHAGSVVWCHQSELYYTSNQAFGYTTAPSWSITFENRSRCTLSSSSLERDNIYPLSGITLANTAPLQACYAPDIMDCAVMCPEMDSSPCWPPSDLISRMFRFTHVITDYFVKSRCLQRFAYMLTDPYFRVCLLSVNLNLSPYIVVCRLRLR